MAIDFFALPQCLRSSNICLSLVLAMRADFAFVSIGLLGETLEQRFSLVLPTTPTYHDEFPFLDGACNSGVTAKCHGIPSTGWYNEFPAERF